MHCVDGKEGYRHWHRHGDTLATENPDWRWCLPLDEQAVLVLDERRTMELALLHSRDYQLQWEELYLSALDVSFERFRFDTLFFGGYQLDYLADGGCATVGESQSPLTASTFPNFRLENWNQRYRPAGEFRQFAGLAVLRPRTTTVPRRCWT